MQRTAPARAEHPRLASGARLAARDHLPTVERALPLLASRQLPIWGHRSEWLQFCAGHGGASELALHETMNRALQRTGVLDSAWIGGIGGAVGAVVSVFAAIAAWRSAGSAKHATMLAAKQIEQAARQQRETSLREANALAHRAAVTGTRVAQMAEEVPALYTQVCVLAGARSQATGPNAIQAKADQRSARARRISEEALSAKATLEGSISDAELAAIVRQMDEFLIELDTMKETVSKELDEYASERRMLREQNAARMTALGGRVVPPLPRT